MAKSIKAIARSHHIVATTPEGMEVHIERFTVQTDNLTVKFGYAAWIFLDNAVVETHPVTEIEPLMFWWLRNIQLHKIMFQSV